MKILAGPKHISEFFFLSEKSVKAYLMCINHIIIITYQMIGLFSLENMMSKLRSYMSMVILITKKCYFFNCNYNIHLFPSFSNKKSYHLIRLHSNEGGSGLNKAAYKMKRIVIIGNDNDNTKS